MSFGIGYMGIDKDSSKDFWNNTMTTPKKHNCSSCDPFPTVDIPPISSKPALIIVEPKCECCGHKHKKYMLVCDHCYKNLIDET